MALERTLVQVRERTLVDVLDLALVVIRSRPGVLGLAGLVGIAPFMGLNALIFRASASSVPGLSLFLWMVEAPLATAPLTVVLGALMFGGRPTPRSVAADLARSAGSLLVVQGFLRSILFFLIPSRLAFANEVILLERARWWSIFRRGGDLCSGRAGELFLTGMLQATLVYLFATASYVGTGRLVQAVMAEGLTWDAPNDAGVRRAPLPGPDLAGGGLLRRGPVLDLHRPAHPPGGLGGGASPPGRRREPGGGPPMVIGFGLALAGLVLGAGGAADSDPSREVGKAMARMSIPWYDAPKDAIRPVRLGSTRDDSRSRGSSTSSGSSDASGSSGGWDFGGWVAFGGFALGLGVLMAALIWFWRTHEPSSDLGADERPRPGAGPIRFDELPAGLRAGHDASDPWAEAVRLRDAGDLAGALVSLFAYQLLALSKRGLIRLAPGRTARQLLRMVDDLGVRGEVSPTLRLFEAAFYGHRAPSPEEFAEVWALAEAFRARIAPGVAP